MSDYTIKAVKWIVIHIGISYCAVNCIIAVVKAINKIKWATHRHAPIHSQVQINHHCRQFIQSLIHSFTFHKGDVNDLSVGRNSWLSTVDSGERLSEPHSPYKACLNIYWSVES